MHKRTKLIYFLPESMMIHSCLLHFQIDEHRAKTENTIAPATQATPVCVLKNN